MPGLIVYGYGPFFQINMVGPAEHEMLKVDTLAFRRTTNRIKTGTMSLHYYRHPAFRQTATTLDVSHMRAYLLAPP